MNRAQHSIKHNEESHHNVIINKKDCILTMSKYHVVGVGKLWKEKDIFLDTFTVLANKLMSDRHSLLTWLLLLAGAGAVMTELYY